MLRYKGVETCKSQSRVLSARTPDGSRDAGWLAKAPKYFRLLGRPFKQKYTFLKYFSEYFGCFKVFVRRICQSISAAGENRLKNWCSFSNPTQIGFANLKAFPCILTIATGQFCFDQEQSRESEAQGFGSQAAGQEYHLIEERVCQWLRG